MKNSMTLPVSHSSGKQKRKNFLIKHYHRLLNEFRSQQTGYATIAIIGQSRLGSAAAMLLLMGGVQQVGNLVLLFFVTILCLAFNGAVLAQLKAKTTFNLLILSLLFSAIIIMAHLF
ncbi:hypothetical protein [Pseudozobellia thermophila]|uniref:Uncharacterized protein n=1 Tax=Pseudozobellia thermophila TaxID=192903 RepID=A0A1M6GLD0_9FLAO|nr:hypothetical protein [Pseudozobellia thermophila]SHJ10752.1 hypothetical protein SAMN04488513_102858 [Pseudozobellia thermophila]